MKNTLTVYSSNREPPQAFTRSVERLMLAGCPVVPQTGTADVTLARNIALTGAVQALRLGTPADVVLMVDDDMSFDLADVERIATHVRATKHATSAAYVMGDGRLAARFVGPRWHTGLGFLAMPAERLLALANEDALFIGKPDGGRIYEFTRSAVVMRDGVRIWSPEDYYLCEQLGGVNLIDLRVAHMKTVPLMPSAEKLSSLIAQHEDRPSLAEIKDFTADMRSTLKS